jgi:murein DD-endopeptidase MepM/ murein hydrolase activator NlpD
LLKKLFFTLVLTLCFTFSNAEEVAFDQKFVQGALITGTTTAAKMRVASKSVDVDENGRFVFGFGRDAKPKVRIEFADQDGIWTEHIYPVEQREYATQEINGVETKYVSPPAEVRERIKKDNKAVANARKTNRKSYEYLEQSISPADGPITGVYGSQRIFNGVPKRPHYGLDIAGPVGHPVLAPMSGQVVFADADLYYSGGTLIIDHGRGVSSTFIHLNKLHVEVGDYVKQGARIADIGATGRVTGPHLDWRLNWFSTRLDPQLLLPQPD